MARRRTIEQMVADTEAERAALLARKAAKADPARKHVGGAKSVEKTARVAARVAT